MRIHTSGGPTRDLVFAGRLSLCLAFLLQTGCTETAAPADPPVGPPGNGAFDGNIAAVSGTMISGTVGARVEEVPIVVVQDARGNVVANVLVQFQIVEGGGSVSGDLVLTNSAGQARLGEWRLGQRPGRHVVEASVGSRALVRFVADARKGGPATLRGVDGVSQTGQPGAAVANLPTIMVGDLFMNPLQGVPVTFSLTSGSGKVSGANAVTDATGHATLESWQLGEIGYHTVVATLPSTPSIPPFVFRAVAVDDLDTGCTKVATLSQDQTLTSSLGESGCRTAAGRTYNLHPFAVGTSAAQLVTLRSSSFTSYLEVYGADGRPVAGAENTPASSAASVRAFLASGQYLAGASALSVAAAGGYEVTLAQAAASNQQCDVAYVTRGVRLIAETAGANCTAGDRSHHYRIYLKAGDVLTVRLLDKGYSWYDLQIKGPSGQFAGADYIPHYQFEVKLAATASGFYSIQVSSEDDGAQYEILFQ